MTFNRKKIYLFASHFFAFYAFLIGLRSLTTAGYINLGMHQGYQITFSLIFALVCTLWNYRLKNLLLYGAVILLWFSAAFCKRKAGMVLSEHEIIQTVGTGFIIYGFCSILVYAASYIKRRWLSTIFKTVILTGFAFCMLPPLWVIGYYIVSDGHLLSSSLLLTLFQTNYEEVKSYLVEQNILLWAVSNAAIIIIIGLLTYFTGSLKYQEKQNKVFVFTLAFGAYMFFGMLPKFTSSFVLGMVINVQKTLQVYKEYNEGSAERQARLDELKKILSTDETSGLHILIMGESTTRDNMGAYGYYRNNTPWMSSIVADNPNAFYYPHAYSTNVQTVESIKYVLTDLNQYENKSLLDSHSITEIASAAGFDTYWISNQKRFNTADTPITAIANSANHRIYINEYIGHKSMTTYYDEQLGKHFPQLKTGQKTLIIFHLMGCHAVYTDRYPSEFEKFTDGTNSRVDHYDNCIAYNDHVLSVLYNEAIKNPDFMSFTFLSDHGEDPEKGITHEVSKFTWHMAHIPLLTIFSDKFAQNHPEIIATLNEHNNSYWTSDLLYNTMITLMGIKNSPDERPDFDIASPDYNMTQDKLTVVEGTYSVKDDDIDKN